MKKRIKVFEAGNYPQGDFNLDRVKEVFSSIDNPIGGIFSHTSKWLNENKTPVDVGEFSNFEVKGGDVYADIEFNAKGTNYYNDGILKGVSVEIDKNTNKLLKIAVLPVGINPAVSTAEFQESETGIVIEFEEVKQVTLEELLAALVGLSSADRLRIVLAALDGLDVAEIDLQPAFTKLWELDDQKWYINKLVAEGYVVEKTAEFSKEKISELAKGMNLQVVEFEREVVLSPEEMRAQIKSEIEFETKLENEITEMKKVIPPALQHVVEFAIRESAKKRAEIVEFSETEKVSEFEKITGDIGKLGTNKVFKTYFNDIAEFENKDDSTSDRDRINAYYGK
ncbi:hypothetical protein [Cetobacterium sp.]|uniref:hypothetical protein n=1 Tax=Cetobacterium sp. TaxID=2071632 RepID=UPI002FCAFF68